MTAARAALIAALLASSVAAYAQSADSSDASASLRAAIATYRAGDLQTAEWSLRRLAPTDAEAEAWLGIVLLDRGKNKEALAALQHAADAGSSEAMHRLAIVFAEGTAGASQNNARAVELFEKAATAGHRRAQINLGTLYFRGQGTQRDLVQARAWFEKAAADGDPYALYALGRAMEDSEGPAVGDPVRAADLYRRAAEKGHPLAALRYGLALSEALGVKRDLAAAQYWMAHAQASGVAEAALALGDMAARTPATRDKDANEKIVQSAIAWYEAAANAGVPSAQFKLANAYFAGAGVARDPEQALQWYRRAAVQGSREAQHALGIMLTGGVAGAADPVEGYKWLLLAEQAGHPDSRSVRDKAAEQIPERDRKRGEALAQRFAPSSERPADDFAPRLNPPRP